MEICWKHSNFYSLCAFHFYVHFRPLIGIIQIVQQIIAKDVNISRKHNNKNEYFFAINTWTVNFTIACYITHNDAL